MVAMRSHCLSIARRIPRRASWFASRRAGFPKRHRRAPIEVLESRSMMAAEFIINELVAANGSGLADVFGDRSDWIEIRNIGDTAGDLQGHHLTDTADELDKWTFPAGTLVPAGGYIIVFASGRDTIDVQGRRHTNFALEA